MEWQDTSDTPASLQQRQPQTETLRIYELVA